MSGQQDAAERLKQQLDDLQLLNQVMRHDIRNDLQLVQAYAELLTDHVDEEGAEYLKIVQENTKSAIALTTTARDLAQVMLREGTEIDEISLSQVLAQQVEEVRTGYPNAVVTVADSFPAVTVQADDMLGSVFRNLLKNAIQHNDKTPPEVEVTAIASEEEVEVRIADNGPGIPDDQKDEIFGKAETGLESPGAGIGLYLVRSLVNTYGGAVWVEDNTPEGAIFVVTLPRA